MRLLVGDIGGTSTRLALATLTEENTVTLSDERRYDSSVSTDLDSFVRDYLAGIDAKVARASLAIAGPVENNRCQTTNLPWMVDGDALGKALGIDSVTLLNDFAAAAWGTLVVAEEDTVVLQDGRLDASAPRVVIGAGTGLGEALVVTGGGVPRVLPGEGGHKGFAPRNERDDRLLAWMRAELGGRVSTERVVSGTGLREVYRFLRDIEGVPESPAVRARMEREDPGAVIGECAVAGSDALCEATLDLMLEAYGAEAGDVALQALAYGGVWVAGGVAAKVLPRVQRGGFMRAFCDKGRMRAVVERVHVRVVTDGSLGLRGAARAAGGSSAVTPGGAAGASATTAATPPAARPRA